MGDGQTNSPRWHRDLDAPTGRTYTTKPGGALFFPILATPTGEVAIGKLTTEPGSIGLDDASAHAHPDRSATNASPPSGASTSNASDGNDGGSKTRKAPTIDGRGRTATLLARGRDSDPYSVDVLRQTGSSLGVACAACGE